jgi:hypothetical protein
MRLEAEGGAPGRFGDMLSLKMRENAIVYYI